MIVADWMNNHPVTVHPEETVEKARELLDSFRVNQLPVVRQRHVIGIVTECDIREASAGGVGDSVESDRTKPTRDVLRKTPVSTVMTTKVVSIRPESSMFAAAGLMHEERISSLPVMDKDGGIVGMIARSDVMRAFLSLDDRKFAAVARSARGHRSVVRPVQGLSPASQPGRRRAS